MGEGSVGRSCVAFFINVARWVPVVFVAAILCWAYYAYVYQLIIVTVEFLWVKVIYFAGFHILLILFVASYFQTIFTPLGKPPQEFFLSQEYLDDLASYPEESDQSEILSRFVTVHDLPVRTKAYQGGVRYCSQCKCIKPDRSHHCSICSQCVLKFDHHCPWVNTCVSFHNYKFFILFLGYGFALCLWGALTDLPYFIQFWQRTGSLNAQVGFGQFHIVFLFFVSAMFCVSLACLFFYHLWLIGKNRSTLESFRPPIFSHGPDKKAYDVGCSRNYRQVFGANRVYWLLPVYSSIGDGVNYPSKDLALESTRLLSLVESDDDDDAVFSRPMLA